MNSRGSIEGAPLNASALAVARQAFDDAWSVLEVQYPTESEQSRAREELALLTLKMIGDFPGDAAALTAALLSRWDQLPRP